MAEVPTPSDHSPVRVQAGGCHPAASPSMRGRRRTRPPAVTRSPDFESGTASMTVSSSMAEDGVLETHSQGATRFPSGDRTLTASSSTAESGRLERHGRSRALVSSEARHPGRFALHGAAGGDRRTARYAQTGAAVISRPTAYAGRESNPHVLRHTHLRRARLPITPPALERAAFGPS
jgi:hypothetical protein